MYANLELSSTALSFSHFPYLRSYLQVCVASSIFLLLLVHVYVHACTAVSFSLALSLLRSTPLSAPFPITAAPRNRIRDSNRDPGPWV